LRAEGAQLRAQYRYHDLAVEYVDPGNYSQLDSIAVPLDALADVEGRDDSPVVFDAVEPDKIVVRWQDRGIPRSKQLDVMALGYIGPFPATAADWTPVSADLLTALEQASKTCSDDTPRYSLSCVQLRGTVHQVVATDGHQVLIQGGFGFPWDCASLIRGSPIFACKAFPRDQPVHVARTETHVLLKIGKWTIFCDIQKQHRFPRVDDAVPANDSITSRVHFDAEDTRFLEAALDSLPGGEVLNSPTTIELKGKVSIRVKNGEQADISELLLNRSSYTGSPIRINTDRAFLRRALQLGFHEIGFAGVESPIVCRNQHATYAWQPLTAIRPSSRLQKSNALNLHRSPARLSRKPPHQHARGDP
jgi:hypothetical protein